MRERTDQERTPKAGALVIEGGDLPLVVHTDRSGQASVPLVPIALAALASGRESVRVQVRFEEAIPSRRDR